MNDVFIRFTRFPTLRVYGLTEKDENDDYNIFIDERLSDERKQQALIHELTHVRKGHFHEGVTLLEAEIEAMFSGGGGGLSLIHC